jgi:hypothetical protein
MAVSGSVRGEGRHLPLQVGHVVGFLLQAGRRMEGVPAEGQISEAWSAHIRTVRAEADPADMQVADADTAADARMHAGQAKVDVDAEMRLRGGRRRERDAQHRSHCSEEQSPEVPDGGFHET